METGIVTSQSANHVSKSKRRKLTCCVIMHCVIPKIGGGARMRAPVFKKENSGENVGNAYIG
ncbi:unnamed protein product [Clavelina lepadiformis]|uniref:Uncharacterized protein n=1 Tax=Clavelina lepadiformis TaxID=159417 RepID=A0ABP0GBM8_CLALP